VLKGSSSLSLGDIKAAYEAFRPVFPACFFCGAYHYKSRMIELKETLLGFQGAVLYTWIKFDLKCVCCLYVWILHPSAALLCSIPGEGSVLSLRQGEMDRAMRLTYVSGLSRRSCSSSKPQSHWKFNCQLPPSKCCIFLYYVWR
jgi:hypothetical protein